MPRYLPPERARIPQETLEEYRRKFESPSKMISAIDEYCPDEFGDLLNAVIQLQAENEALLARIRALVPNPLG